MKRKRVVFLYTELAGYFLSCIKALANEERFEIHIIHWPLNQEAPFKFDFPDQFKFYPKKELSKSSLMELTDQINPDLIYCSGWIDKDYLKICKKYKNKIPVIVGFDNQWVGSTKQWLAVVSKTFTISPYFSHAWVPGEKQAEFALKLGFLPNKILKGFYSADFDFFHSLYLKDKETKQTNFPKCFIYVGRYVEHKGLKDLWQAFMELQNEQPNEWELWCLGVGPLTEQAVQHSKIKHFGFIQPSEMEKFIAKSGVFVLPSHFEPWGVAVHEFSAAGFPLVLSKQVGASEQFLKNEENGFIFNAGNVSELKAALLKIMNRKDTELIEMGQKSVEMAKSITPEKWAKTLIKVLKSD